MRTIPVLAAWLVLAGCGSGKQDPAGLVKDYAFGFGLVPPQGWTLVTPQSAPDFIAKYGMRLTGSMKESFLRPVSGNTSFVQAYVKTDSYDPLLPVIAVVHNTVGLPKVGADELQKSRTMMKRKMEGAGIRDYTEQASQIIDVDGFQATQIEYLATVDLFKLHVIELMIASKTRTHFLSLYSDQVGWTANYATFKQVQPSFRSYGGR